ncbi:rRNA adenine N-6-methyltransferase family protein [Kribbella sp. NPDC056861]|uniref:rRNA adenine N-6-methyltransferase family protein n=1 Tax=Kribbella sp. NPDC056861 TaxID=3154857 RepID=UPI00341BBAB5
MTTNDRGSEAWHRRAGELVATLEEKGHLTDPRLKAAFTDVPRHLFVPEYLRIELDENGFAIMDGKVNRSDPDYLDAVYTDQPLMTQTKPVEGQPDSFVWSSSSSMPSVMADMIEELDVQPGMTILESGTGTGYNAAILCHLLGDHAVTTLEIDPDLLAEATGRLDNLGYHPATDPAGRLFDRILATHAVDNVPYDWIRWSKPGAIILTDLRPPSNTDVGAWLKLTVDPDGKTATGKLMPPRGYFMSARKVPEYADIGHQLPELTLDEHQSRAELMVERETHLSPIVFQDEKFGLYFWRQSIDVWWWNQSETINLNAPDGSWAQVQDGTVNLIGPRDIWAEAENAYERWNAAGQPDLAKWTVEVSADGRTVTDLPK